jgi:Sporulation and spore germination
VTGVGRARRRVRLRRAVVGLGLVLTACGVQPDSAPRDLPEAERALPNVSGDDTDASGADRVYLIGPGEDRLLRSVQREATSPFDLMQILLRGPNDDEIQSRYNTAIPSTTELIGTRTQGQVLTVNLTDDIVELDTPSLTQAIAQIVYTATELPNIAAVRIEIDGEPMLVPTPSGASITDSLQVYDFPNAVQTSQPPFPLAALTATP